MKNVLKDSSGVPVLGPNSLILSLEGPTYSQVLGPKTILCMVFGLFLSLRERFQVLGLTGGLCKNPTFTRVVPPVKPAACNSGLLSMNSVPIISGAELDRGALQERIVRGIISAKDPNNSGGETCTLCWSLACCSMQNRRLT